MRTSIVSCLTLILIFGMQLALGQDSLLSVSPEPLDSAVTNAMIGISLADSSGMISDSALGESVQQSSLFDSLLEPVALTVSLGGLLLLLYLKRGR